MKIAEFKALKHKAVYPAAIGYGPHRKAIGVSLHAQSHITGTVWVFGHGHKNLYHYRSIQLHPRVSADLLKESNNNK